MDHLLFSINASTAFEDLPAEFVWMPKGLHTIAAGSMSGGTWKGSVRCDVQGAENVKRDFNASLNQGRRVWIDFNHEEGEAAGWVTGFSWDEARGIICHVRWTQPGAEALRTKSFYSFSPAFLVDHESGRVAGLIIGHAAGGIVNSPAFQTMPALVAARLSGEAFESEAVRLGTAYQRAKAEGRHSDAMQILRQVSNL